jgi:hypothetical protein
MSDPRTVKLRVPIQFGSETIEELAIRRPKAKDLRRLSLKDGAELDMVLTLTSRLTGQPDGVIDQLEGADLVEVLEIVAGFLPSGPRTGSAE